MKALPTQRELITLCIMHDINGILNDCMPYDRDNPIGLQIQSMVQDVSSQYNELLRSLPEYSNDELLELKRIAPPSYLRFRIIDVMYDREIK